MADDPNLAVICGGLGRLAISKWPPEIQWMVVTQAVKCSDKVGIGCLAVVNKTWQSMVESLTFRCIKISLAAQDSDGPDHFISILTPARAFHLKELVIEVHWPFYLGAQAGTPFSGTFAVKSMEKTISALISLFKHLRKVTISSPTGGLSLILQAIKPPFVPPHGGATARVLMRRRVKPAEIDSSWQHTKMQKLSVRSTRIWALRTKLLLQLSNSDLPNVTSLTFPPDFFHPYCLPVFLSRFPNLTNIELKPMCKMSDPEGWCTHLFSLKLTDAPILGHHLPNSGPIAGYDLPNSAPNISTLILGRTLIQEEDEYIYSGNPAEKWSSYPRVATDPRLVRYVNALRDYTKGLKKLVFDHFAAETQFYLHFFTDPLPTSFQWEKLEHVHIKLFGDGHYHRKRIPMAIDRGAHLSPAGKLSVIALFNAAGTAVARMPRLQTMTIHIPRREDHFLLSVTLKFVFQSRRDGRMAAGIYGSIGLLQCWAAPIGRATETIWRRSIGATGRKMFRVVWHTGECPDFMEPHYYYIR